MKVSAAWLQQFLSKPVDTKTMAEALEASGIEVEQIVYAKKIDEQIIVAEIKKVVQHPNADKLKLATIYDGSNEIELVCGAPNLKEGQLVPFAPVGATLPNGTVLKAAQIRGVVSLGMLCSPQELGQNLDHGGLLLLDATARPGTPLVKLLPASDVIDVTTQANRFDLLSVIGLAREIAAQTGVTLNLPTLKEPDSTGDAPAVEIEAKTAVRRYMLVEFSFAASGLVLADSQLHLEAAGVRRINPIVDLTNLVMLEFGQPLHAFDASKVKAPIVVRFAQAKEILVTLDGVSRVLTVKDLVIADARGPIALAGLMGGRSSEVTPQTTQVLLESASFDGAVVRKMAQRHGLRTEASARFERNLPVKLAEVGLQRALELYHSDLSASQSSSVFDDHGNLAQPGEIVAEPKHISKVLSIEVSASDLAKQLPKLGFGVTTKSSQIVVAVPWWRPDVTLVEDLAEEYIRLIGYDSVPARLPIWRPRQVRADQYWPQLWQLKQTLKGQGLFEVITYSFVSQQQLQQFDYDPSDHLKLQNPLSLEQAYLRRNLLPSLLSAVVRNQNYRLEFGIYETSQVFWPQASPKQPHEPKHLAVLVKSQQPYPAVKAMLDNLQAAFGTDLTFKPTELSEFLSGRAAQLESAGQTIGRIGQLHPRFLSELKQKVGLGYLELDLEQLFAASDPKHYQPISRFPSLYRDLAVIVDKTVLWQDIERAIAATELGRPTFLNDYYDASLGAGKKSLAIRLEMLSLTATLTDKEADKRLKQIIALLAGRFKAVPRS